MQSGFGWPISRVIYARDYKPVWPWVDALPHWLSPGFLHRARRREADRRLAYRVFKHKNREQLRIDRAVRGNPTAPKVIDGPARLDSDLLARIVRFPNGWWRVETWDRESRSWVEGGADSVDVVRASELSSEELAREGADFYPSCLRAV